jgi:osmotically-inducible protein OsmY
VRAAWVLLSLLLASCRGSGYRDPGGSEALVDEIEDRNVASRVRVALATDPETAPYEAIRVVCRDGVVTLEGEVGRAAVRRRAVGLAQGCPGVAKVVDRITVSSE